jgi:hypothetical protein
MNQYDYILNEQSLEIFPAEIINDPLIVFHGTSSYYSDIIEENGFERGYSPFEQFDVENLASLLEREGFRNFDVNNIAGSLRHYLSNKMRLSFTSLSGAAINFATDISKGGQIIGKIRKAEEIVNDATADNAELNDFINQSIRDLFALCNNISNDSGVVYAIRLPNDLNGIKDENLVVYSDYSIPAVSIVGKVILPDEVVEIVRENIIRQNKEKLIKGLGRILHQKDEEE